MASASPREQLHDTAQTAKESVRSTLTEQKDGAASSIGELAGALRKAAHEGGDGNATHMAEWAADGLERMSATLRSNDLNGMVRQVQSFARSQPVAFFFAAAAAGFLATRFIKAGSAPDSDGGTPELERDPGGYESSGDAIGKTDISSTIPL